MFDLQDWYSSEGAKRKFGPICQAVNEESREIELGGSVDRPLLSLVDTSLVPTEKDEVEISIIEATANWSSVTAAALFYGTVFRIRGKRVVRAILRRHRVNRHGAHKYRRRQIEDMSQTLSTFIKDFERVSKRLDETNDLIRKHFCGHSQDLRVSEVTAEPKELSEAQMRGPPAQPPGPELEEHKNTRTRYITHLIGSEEKHPCAKYDDLESAFAAGTTAAAGDVERVCIYKYDGDNIYAAFAAVKAGELRGAPGLSLIHSIPHPEKLRVEPSRAAERRAAKERAKYKAHWSAY